MPITTLSAEAKSANVPGVIVKRLSVTELLTAVIVTAPLGKLVTAPFASVKVKVGVPETNKVSPSMSAASFNRSKVYGSLSFDFRSVSGLIVGASLTPLIVIFAELSAEAVPSVTP